MKNKYRVLREEFELKCYRKEKKLTQKQIEKLLNCEKPFISKVEKEEHLFPETMQAVLRDIYGDITEYITIKEDMKLQGVTPAEFLEAGADAFTRQMVRMMNDKLIAPYGLLEEKDKQIEQLNRIIGGLESELSKLKKD